MTPDVAFGTFRRRITGHAQAGHGLTKLTEFTKQFRSQTGH